MDLRREERTNARVNALVWSLDANGNISVQQAQTADISASGGCLFGMKSPIDAGAIIGIQNGSRRIRFRVAWAGEPGSTRAGQIGIERVEAEKQPARLLYIDDEDRNATDQRRSMLEALGYDIAVADFAMDGIQRLQKDQFSAVLVGYPLRDIETGELLVSIKRSGVKTKTILLSAYSTAPPESLVELVDAIVTKRDPNQNLVTAIERVISDRKHIKFPEVRHIRRYGVRVPFVVQVLRSGIATSFYGNSEDIGERGIGGRIKAELAPGELVKVVFALPNSPHEITAHAVMRHRDENFFGFEFVSIDPRAIQTIRSLCAVLPPLARK